MNSKQLTDALDALCLNPKEFALLLGVTTRAVNMWCSGDREVPNSTAAYINLLQSLPRALQAREVARIHKENQIMYDGMYSIEYVGTDGNGVAALVFLDGVVFGHDGGVSYDGTYEPCRDNSNSMDVRLKLTVAPGVPLVQGVPPQPAEYMFPVNVRVPARQDVPLNIETPYGSVAVNLCFLRALPTALAA